MTATTWRFINYNTIDNRAYYSDYEIRNNIKCIKSMRGKLGPCNPEMVKTISESWYKDYATLTIRYKDGGTVQRIWKRL